MKEPSASPKPSKTCGSGGKRAEDSDEEEDIILAEGLLTALTDTAISNLSQLAALQERCESQQQHSHQPEYQQNQPAPATPTGAPATKQQQHQRPHCDIPSAGAILEQDETDAAAAAAVDQSLDEFILSQDPFALGQAPLLVSPAPADLGAGGQSLASTVAAAAMAAAAAAASDEHQQPPYQIQHHLTHQRNPQEPRARLLTSPTSALASPDFYPSLHHAQGARHSPSSLHFSPSASITPSPSSQLVQSRRSVASNASSLSCLMSPVASPSYLRRQFMPDRLAFMSPSPTCGLGGTSSAGLAQLLHQQRSASAMGGGSISSPSPVAWSPLSGSTSSAAVSPLMNNKNSSQARLNNMQIRHKFGYLGSGRAQFNSPHGFCLGLNQEIVVADTNNHRVCIFDKGGTYITQFGSPGKEEGQLWNPRKVAILHRPTLGSPEPSTSAARQLFSHQSKAATGYSFSTGPGQCANSASGPLYVVCDRGAERSRMQLFTKDGSFIKKIGIHYIDIVAGLAITQNGLIIVVDSVSPTVYIINGETGVLNGWFDCSGHMKEPSDIAVKSDAPGNEYFICDFKGHCVVVFSEQGEYLRRIGHDGLTSYPNGIDISDDGDILVGDSHGNRFHVVVFDRNGNFVSQFECPHVKVSRCCGLKITREGYIVTLAKNNHHVLVLDTIHI